MDVRAKLIVSSILTGFCTIQIGIFICKYIDALSTLDSNPLIPKGLSDYVGNFTIAICIMYFVAMLPNIYYITKRRQFWITCALSVIFILLSRIMLPYLYNLLN